MQFKLDKEQEARAKKFCASHREEHKNVREMTGAAYRFIFLPTGMGDNVEVECINCPAKIILTIGDDGEFLFNEDGSRNGW